MLLIGNKKEYFSQGDQTFYTKPMPISKIFSLKGMMMTKLELFLILFPVDYLKEVLISNIKKIMKHPMNLG